MPYAIAEFHTYFRMEFKQIYELADKYEEEGLNLREFLRHAEGLHQHLHMHHTIEEVHIFPILATRMPEFQKETGSHLKQHEQIHDGLDAYSAYISKCRQMPSVYKPTELREIMDGFEKVLFQHLDEEVESLKGRYTVVRLQLLV
ncbi:hypothetical protein P389DRAFT_141074 [Cystobasidium minutum MCA 4210]|uniref:uncharacterized protein n=1 Tax=Cystobasidium minutum MCA 4210 TaxID=1397322 RepID=UPI0034CF884F|eukprot:jgi/Rhomi1/141074/e_gw1.2.866.1